MTRGMPAARSLRRRARMEDVARLAGVARGTVSNVLNHPEKVADATRQRVVEAIRALDFVPDHRARALAAGRGSIVGMVVPDLMNSLFVDIARGAEQQAGEAGLHLLLANSDRRLDKELVYLDLYRRERVAGILFAPQPSHAHDVTLAVTLDRHDDTPMVLVNYTAGPDRCAVTSDDERGGYLAARHLVETGRRRLAFVGGPMSLVPVRQRYDGVRRAVRETAGAVGLDTYRTAELRVEDGRRAGLALAALPADERPDGVVAAADLVALGIVQVLLAETGLRVPDDLGLVGYDNNRAAWESVVPLSTLAQPGEEMGRAATRLLQEEVRVAREGREAHAHRRVVLEPRLVVRASSARPSTR